MVQKFSWNREVQVAFEWLKMVCTTASTLIHLNPERQGILEADSLMHTLGVRISQPDCKRMMRSIAFHSRKFNPTELNYDIYDKEMLVIIDSLEHYYYVFEELEQQIMTYSNHLNLL